MYEVGHFLCIIAFFIPWGIEILKEKKQEKQSQFKLKEETEK